MEARRDTYRKLLWAEREAIHGLLKRNARFGLLSRAGETELSQYDNHPADTAGDLFEREKDVALMNDAFEQLSEIDAALERLNRGRYGLCEACGRPIDPKRLLVVPTARRCIQCQSEFDDARKADEAARGRTTRPAEEDVIGGLRPAREDRLRGEPGVDGEDVWQMLEHYGSSDTPDSIEPKM
ncbi:MAG: TraR/DksA C4-type zinc finger protein [Hydrogenibacillus sp.]|nr:TraR/DksA C4-type zinc finger protein [Hydrogenibacillus sp.]